MLQQHPDSKPRYVFNLFGLAPVVGPISKPDWRQEAISVLVGDIYDACLRIGLTNEEINLYQWRQTPASARVLCAALRIPCDEDIIANLTGEEGALFLAFKNKNKDWEWREAMTSLLTRYSEDGAAMDKAFFSRKLSGEMLHAIAGIRNNSPIEQNEPIPRHSLTADINPALVCHY